MAKKSIKSSKLGRLAQLGTSLAKAGTTIAVGLAKEKKDELVAKGRELSKDLNYRVKAAQEIVTTMGELKGGLMKIGQMISISEDLVLPKEITAIFSQLQNSVSSVPEEEIRALFQKHFNAQPEELFAEFDIQPIAAASIGQVHRAKLKTGEDVAIKVQYPKIVDAIKADFQNVKKIKSLFEIVFPEIPDIEHTIQEVKETILLECDYLNEAKNMDAFRELYKDRFPQFIIPKTYPEWTSSEILTMEYVQGDTFNETLNYSQEDRDFLGQVLLDCFMYSFYQAGMIHSDPQNGNYLFRKDKIVLLDFGCVRNFDIEFISIYSSILTAVETNNLDLYYKSAVEMKFIMPDDDMEFVKNHFKLVKDLYSPYLKEGSYKIDSSNPFSLVNDFIKGIKLKGRVAPRKELVHLDRASIGLYTKLKSWQAKVDYQGSRRKYRDPIQHKIDDYWEKKDSGIPENVVNT